MTVEGAAPSGVGAGGGGSRGSVRKAGPRAMRSRDVDEVVVRRDAIEADRWSAIGHELRTPLNGILGHVGLLLEGIAGPLSADARACLGDVQAAGRRLMRQIDWLLLLAQVQAVAPRIEASVDLVDLIRAALRRSGGLAAEDGGATFLVRGDPFWLEVLADALAELSGGADAPRLDVTLHADREVGELHLSSPQSARAAAGPLPWRLIESIVARLGAKVVAREQSLWLKWPETG